MPELPDITIYREALEARLRGRVLRRVRILNPFLLRTAVPPIAEAEGKRVRDVIKAERMRMEMESEALGRVRERIDRFMSGDTAIAYDEQRFAFERLEREIEVLKERKAELMAESEESDDDSEEESVVEPPRRGRVRKTDEGAIVILCGDTEVPLDGLEQHAAQFYGASTFCPRGCGYFVPSRRANEMAKHVTTRACAARVQEIERLRK